MPLKKTVVFFVVLLHCAAAFSITDTAQLKQVGITEKLGEQIPGDISLVNHLGEKRNIGQFFDGQRPVLLNLVFYTCPHNCRFAMQFLTETANALADRVDSLKIGDDYRVLTVSFDETDTSEIAARKAEENRTILTYKEGRENLLFFTAGRSEIKRITETAGFEFRKEGEMFDHQSALIVLTPEGKIARYLYGIQHSPSDVKLALIEASDGKIGGGGIINKVLLFCYKFDPVGKKYALRAINIVKLSGVVTLLVLTVFLYRMWRRKA
ncbi:MAG: hypothetical protein GKS04_02350 [Candidatus Mycalebacterium zealandia]|nr:MAG: hypothetical protein GKS04_02350 [Candidatus Mycalebacterium zealandia]